MEMTTLEQLHPCSVGNEEYKWGLQPTPCKNDKDAIRGKKNLHLVGQRGHPSQAPIDIDREDTNMNANANARVV